MNSHSLGFGSGYKCSICEIAEYAVLLSTYTLYTIMSLVCNLLIMRRFFAEYHHADTPYSCGSSQGGHAPSTSTWVRYNPHPRQVSVLSLLSHSQATGEYSLFTHVRVTKTIISGTKVTALTWDYLRFLQLGAINKNCWLERVLRSIHDA